MVGHFKALNTPLRSIHTYPTLEDQENRFSNIGWAFVTARSLWDLWSDHRFIPSNTRISLQSVEPFDEWEEFTLFASHYFLLVASNETKAGTVSKLIEVCPLKQMENAYNHDGAARGVLDMIVTVPRQSGVTHSDYSQDRKKVRAFGVLFQSEETAFCHHGGYSGQGRLNTSDIYLTKENAEMSATAPPLTMEARMNHTATTVSISNGLLGFDCLLVGGRTAPDHALSDCW
jgi:tRNA wybutosine-synthesizing protein 4